MGLEGKYLRTFLRRIIKGDGCWEWDGAHTSDGYAESWDGMRPVYAHRIAYELWVGPIPEGYEVDHFVCDNSGCLRPNHLKAVPPRENNMRSRSAAAHNARKTHCPQGHPYDEANTWIDGLGRRVCRTCKAARAHREWVTLRQGVQSNACADRTHCPRGHPYDETNTYHYVTKRGGPGRLCKTCNRERDAARRARLREERVNNS